MDATDFRVVARLFRDGRTPYEALGRDVGLSGNAVKARLERLSDEGVLRGFAALPERGVLGLQGALLVFRDVEELERREREILQGAPDIGRIAHVDVGLDRSVSIHAYYQHEEDFDRLERAAANLVGKAPAQVIKFPARLHEERVTGLDWRILRALQADGRKSLSALSKDTGASYKTVKRRLEGLLARRAVTVAPVLSAAEAQGVVLYEALVLLNDAGDRAAVRELFPADAIAMPVRDPAGIRVWAIRDNLRAAQADLHRVKRSALVAGVIFNLGTRHPLPDVLGPELEERIREVQHIAMEKGEVSLPPPRQR